MRRASPRVEPSLRLEVADLAFDLVSRRVRRGDRVIELQTKEFTLLEYLMRNQGRVLAGWLPRRKRPTYVAVAVARATGTRVLTLTS